MESTPAVDGVGYTDAQLAELDRWTRELTSKLTALIETNIVEAARQPIQDAREYLEWGAGRRLNVIQLSIGKIFELFPPERQAPLPRSTLYEIQVYLHAFVSNVARLFDCWAWAFVCRHQLLGRLSSRMKVGMFVKECQRLLPVRLQEALSGSEDWHQRYLKQFRDALAHRIPLYLPPAAYTAAEARRYRELQQLVADALRARDTSSANQLMDEQEQLGTACLTFHQGLTSEGFPGAFMHFQLATDVATIVDFGTAFYDCWQEGPAPAQQAVTT